MIRAAKKSGTHYVHITTMNKTTICRLMNKRQHCEVRITTMYWTHNSTKTWDIKSHSGCLKTVYGSSGSNPVRSAIYVAGSHSHHNSMLNGIYSLYLQIYRWCSASYIQVSGKTNVASLSQEQIS